MTDEQLTDAYADAVRLGREAGNQPPVYRRLQALAGELERRGIARPAVPS
jgi:hypothetical protein